LYFASLFNFYPYPREDLNSCIITKRFALGAEALGAVKDVLKKVTESDAYQGAWGISIRNGFALE